MLQPLLGEQLHAHANAKERRTANENPLMHRLDHALGSAQTLCASLEAADARQHDPVRRADHVGIGSNRDIRPDLAQRIFDRMEIARAVIDQRSYLTH